MRSLVLELDGERRGYLPGEIVFGRIYWTLEEEPDLLVLRLFWYTEGKGTRDVDVVGELDLQKTLIGESDFSFEVPDRPYSFSGRLISIVWALELVATPGGVERVEIVVGPSGEEVRVERSGTAEP